MSEGWYYAKDEKICGPISLENLETLLSIVPDPYNLRVWKAGFPDWTVAGAVKELAALIQTPPPLPEKRDKQASEIKLPPLNAPPPPSQNSTAGNKNSSSTVKRPWSLMRAALSGLLVMVVVSAVHSPIPWPTTVTGFNLELASYWIGYFAVGPILFVVVAAIRNLSIVRNRNRDRVGRGLFRAWVVVSALWIAGTSVVGYWTVVPDVVHGNFQAEGRIKVGLDPANFDPKKPFYDQVRSPSVEKLKVTFLPLDWATRSKFDEDAFMKKFEVENGGFVYMPKSYNNEDTKYIVLQFVDQSWGRWGRAAATISLWALIPCIALFILGYTLLWIGRGFKRA
jgi:GYF domain 2